MKSKWHRWFKTTVNYLEANPKFFPWKEEILSEVTGSCPSIDESQWNERYLHTVCKNAAKLFRAKDQAREKKLQWFAGKLDRTVFKGRRRIGSGKEIDPTRIVSPGQIKTPISFGGKRAAHIAQEELMSWVNSLIELNPNASFTRRGVATIWYTVHPAVDNDIRLDTDSLDNLPQPKPEKVEVVLDYSCKRVQAAMPLLAMIVDGYNYQEISDFLGIAKGTITYRIEPIKEALSKVPASQAIQWLRQRFG